jgi:glycerophosphoryl diester phosphodiesterase
VPAARTVAELLALERPIVLAHAGGDDVHPHGTPYGFDRSADAGVDVLDMDVQLTADGVLVVQHDATVDRTTEGSGEIAAMTYEQVHALDAAHWFTEDCTCKDRPEEEYVLRGVRTGDRPPPDGASPEDFAITAFEEIAAAHPEHVLNVEIKGEAPDAIPAAHELARIVREMDLTDRIVVTSFDDEVVDAFAAAAPDVAITPGLGATAAYVLGGTLPPAGRTILQVPPEYEGIEVVTADWVEKVHADGLVVWVWPNDAAWEDGDGYRRLLDMGVDGLNAADPATAVEVVRSRT